MIASLVPSPSWTLPSKQRLGAFLSQAPARCRVAPSPTGHMHLGTLRTALHNFLAARASGGQFVLRIDDTDQARNHPDHTALIHRTLGSVGLTPDHCFHQSGQHASHQMAVQALLDTGWAVRDGQAVRLAPHARGLAPDQFFDLAAGVCPLSNTFLDHADGLVLIRSDGTPTYHFASVVDDINYQINLILRGVDHHPNVAKHVVVARALAQARFPHADAFCQQVAFAHVGLIMKDRKKLSKRDQSSNLGAHLGHDTPPGALLQWALTLGWGHPDPAFDKRYPLISMDVMPSLFAQGGLRAVNCNLSTDKLAALTRKWKTGGPA